MINQSFKEIASFYMDALSILGVNSKDIIIKDQDIACKCPVCGDSKYRNKKRLHLYKKGDVINVNCFNGDCPVHNMTPYSFFKEYVPRIFEEFKNFNRKRYLLEIQHNKKDYNKSKLETIKADFTLDSLDFNKNDFELNKTDKTDKLSEILEIIKNFEFTGNEFVDLENIKNLIKNIKQDKELYKVFRDCVL